MPDVMFAQKFDEAAIELKSQCAVHNAFTERFPNDTVNEWKAMIEIWSKDPYNAPNPFLEPEPGERHYKFFHLDIARSDPG